MIRNASHAGNWYLDNKKELNKQLEIFFSRADQAFAFQGEKFPINNTRAIIAPHAGFQYSGPTAAFAYKAIDTSNINRVFLLGPSHHAYIDGCCLSKCDTYETPLGNLQLDRELIKELNQTGRFNFMSLSVDEKEHSIEMHLPFTYKLFEEKIDEVKIVPILVGSISDKKEKMYGEILAKYFDDPTNLFIISSDFCHWGSRFRYTYYTKTNDDDHPIKLGVHNEEKVTRPIHESIKELDHRAIHALESLSFSDFQAYLQTTGNTICGRHPIAVLMASLQIVREKKKSTKQTLKCIKYDQSSACKTYDDSSVSYAGIYIQIE